MSQNQQAGSGRMSTVYITKTTTSARDMVLLGSITAFIPVERMVSMLAVNIELGRRRIFFLA